MFAPRQGERSWASAMRVAPGVGVVHAPASYSDAVPSLGQDGMRRYRGIFGTTSRARVQPFRCRCRRADQGAGTMAAAWSATTAASGGVHARARPAVALLVVRRAAGTSARPQMACQQWPSVHHPELSRLRSRADEV